MKKFFLLISISVFIGLIYLAFYTSQLYAAPPFEVPPKGGLNACLDELAACQIFPGDGYDDPDAYGLSGHGPDLRYTNNGDGTFTDENTRLMWEIKDDLGGIHDKDNPYTWTATSEDIVPDGTLFTVFLDALNNTCNGDGVDGCADDDDCIGIGNEVCGLAGYQDWRIPNIRELHSLVDYSTVNPASSVPGSTVINRPETLYWSATTYSFSPILAWVTEFISGDVERNLKSNADAGARAVRP